MLFSAYVKPTKKNGHDNPNMEIKVFSGNANRDLAEKICADLKIPLGDSVVSKFSDGETRVEIKENIRGQDVFLVQSTCQTGQ